MSVASLAAILRSARFNFGNERELQEGIAEHLRAQRVTYVREYVLSKRDRADFFVAEKIAIEVKLQGSVPKLFEQLQRYALHERVAGVVVVVSRSKFLEIPAEISGKPVEIVLQRGFL